MSEYRLWSSGTALDLQLRTSFTHPHISLKCTFKCFFYPREVIRYHVNTRGFRVGLQVEKKKWAPSILFDFLLLLGSPLLPHIIPDSRASWHSHKSANRELTETKIHQRETKVLAEMCLPPCFVTVELFSFFFGAGVEGIYCEVQKTKSIVPTESSVWLVLLYCMSFLKVWL